MQINIINTCTEVRHYIEKVKNGASTADCWEKEVVAVHWDALCCYAPFDLSERKPQAITDISVLEQQCDLLEKLDTDALRQVFERAVAMLPNYDDDPLTVAIFPGDHNNETVNEKQSGVVGTSLFGNMMIQVDPLVEGYEPWIGYVFAHEYHHTVWGNYWYMLHGGELENQFIDSLILDGEADRFALELYPELRPQWLFGIPEASVETLWEETYRAIADKTDVDYVSYMFGNEALGIPWCAGYAVGYLLVQRYLQKTGRSIVEILEQKPSLLLKELLEG